MDRDLNVELKQGERIEDLQEKLADGKNAYLIQNPKLFCFGVDAVLLTRFAHVRQSDTLLDLCTGCGIVPILMHTIVTPKSTAAVEILPEMADMASRSVKLNGLNEQVDIICYDLREYNGKGQFSHVTCNPPYKETGGGLICPDDAIAIARHEIMAKLEDCVAAAARALVFSGRFSMIHRPERLPEIFEVMRKHGIEPKRLQMVYPSTNKSPAMVLVEGRKGCKPKLYNEPPIFVNM